MRQVTEVATQVALLAPTHIVTSTQLRAMETTRIVASLCEIIPDTHPAFVELVRPTWLVGYHYTGFTTMRYILGWFLDRPVVAGESYKEFRARITQAKRYLETFPPDARIVVVSHSVFTNLFVEHLCNDNKLTFLEGVKSFIRIFSLQNAGLIHLQYSPGKDRCGWSLVKRK